MAIAQARFWSPRIFFSNHSTIASPKTHPRIVMPRSDMGVYTFHLGRTVFVFGLILALFALRGSCNALVNIAAASISRNPQDPSTHVFYQGPDGELYHRAYVDSSWNSPQKVPTMIPPKPNTPLATWYYDNAQAIHMVCS